MINQAFLPEEKYIDKFFNLKYEDYNYKIEFDAVFKNGDFIKLKDHLNKITIVHMYDEFVYPMMKANLYINKNLYNRLADNAEDIKFRVNIKKVLADPSDNNKVMDLPRSVYKNIMLIPVDFNRNLFGKHRTDEEQYSHNNESPLELELIAEDHFKINRGRLKYIYTNINMKNLLAKLYADVIPKGELLIHYPDNIKIYDQIIMIGKNLPTTIKDFQRVYGIYETGLRIFFDYNDYYCIPNDLKGHNVKEEENKFKNVYIYVQDTIDNRSIDLSGCYEDKKNNRYVVLSESVNSIITNDFSNRESTGEELSMFEYKYKGSRVDQKEKDNKSSVNNKKPIMTNIDKSIDRRVFKKYDNDYTLSSKVIETIKNNLRVVLMLRNIDDSILAMNRKYFIQFRNKNLNENYKGTYQITGKAVTFSKNGLVYEYNCFGMFNRLTKEILSIS